MSHSTDLRKLLIEARDAVDAIRNEHKTHGHITDASAHWLIKVKPRIDAALAEKVAPIGEVVIGPKGDVEGWTVVQWLTKTPPVGTKLYTAPQSGVRAGMLRAAEICKEWEGKLSQGAGYAIRTAREAITRAADQVKAEGCTRSHPHENMSADCEQKTVEARDTNSRSNAMQAVKKDAPVMKAWNNYKSSDEFKNTRKWALHEEHVDGSLWAAFYAGFFACAVDQVKAEGQVEPLQLPPLNEVMYHAVRGLELDFGSGESLFQGSIDDDTLDLIWESINTALRCAKVSPSAPPSASQPDTVAVPRKQLEHWAEYWNGNANEKSMTDALEHILDEIDAVLQAAQEAK